MYSDSSCAIVVLLTKHALFHATLTFAIEAAIKYSVPVILVHDQQSCLFPSPAEQPESLQVYKITKFF